MPTLFIAYKNVPHLYTIMGLNHKSQEHRGKDDQFKGKGSRSITCD